MALLDLAARYGLVNATTRGQLQAQLRTAVSGGAPTSLARLMIGQGQGPEVMAAILASGEHASAVVCDACGQARSQDELPDRSEVACLHCGSLIMGFRAFAKPPAPGTQRISGTTRRFDEVLPVPGGEDPNSETSPYGVILPTPGRQPETGEAEEAFDTLLNTVTAGPPTRVSATQAFGSANEVVSQLAIDPNQAEGDPTVEEDARDKVRAELGVASGAAIPLFGAPDAAPSPVSAAPPTPAPAQPQRSLWPLALIMLLLLGLSALGLVLLLRSDT
jgi:hypothetical protein